jgi:hypothetical protein
LDRLPKIYYRELLCVSEGTLSRWSRLHLQSLAPTNPHWARRLGYGLFSLCVIHKEGLWPSSEDINRLMMMVTSIIPIYPYPNMWVSTKNFHHVVIKIGQLFSRPTACLRSFLGNGDDANDCKFRRNQRLNVPSEVRTRDNKFWSPIRYPTFANVI